MAPEQVEGVKITRAADIYAFGVVLYEMVTGQWPFKGETPLATAVKRLKEQPPPPRSLVPDLDPRWDRVILRCLARKPEDRFASAEDAVRELRGESAIVPKSRSAMVLAAGVAAMALLVALAVFIVLRIRHRVNPSTQASPALSQIPPMPAKLRPSVAVLGFKNLSGERTVARVSTELSDLLDDQLGSGGALRVVSGEDVARMKQSLSLPDEDSFAPDTLAKIGSYLAASYVVVGSYMAAGDPAQGQITVDLTLQNTRRGETMDSVSEAGALSVDGLYKLVSKGAEKLRKDLGVGNLSSTEAASVRAAAPSNSVANQYYYDGLRKLWSYDALAARDLLEKAVAADPSFSLAHSALASAWSALGYDAQAAQEAKKALDLSRGLPRADRLLVEARYHEMSHQLTQAAETYRSLWQFYPDDLEYGLRLARLLAEQGKGQDAMQVTAALKKLPAPANADPRIDLAQASAAAALGNYKAELAAASEAEKQAESLGARIQLAAALNARCWSEHNLNQPKQAIADCQQAQQIYTALGDAAHVANTLVSLAAAYDDVGDAAQAMSLQKQALEIYRRVGDEAGVATCENNIAVELESRGDFKEALPLAERSLQLGQKLGRRHTTLDSLNTIAGAYFNQGNYESARKAEEQYLATARQIGDGAAAARALGNLALILSYEGKTGETMKMDQQALAAWREVGSNSGVASTLLNIGDLDYEQGDARAAEKQFAEALVIARQIGSRALEAKNLENLGAVSYDEGELEKARQFDEQSLALFRPMGYQLQGLAVLNDLGDILLAEGQLDEAQKSYDEAGAIAQAQKSRGDILMGGVKRASVFLAKGNAAEAAKLAQAAAAQFGRAHHGWEEAVAETVLARADLAQGNAAGALRAANEAVQLAPEGSDVHPEFDASTVQARALAAAGKSADAQKVAAALFNKARSLGLIPYALRAEIALGEIEIKTGNVAAGRTHLESARKEAQVRGFLLLSNRAAQALGGRAQEAAARR